MAAYIRNGRVLISVPIHALVTGWKACIDGNHARKGYEDYRIVDADAFARDLVRALNHENPDSGETMVTKLIDRAVEAAIEDGARGVAEVEHKKDLECSHYGAGADCKCPLKKG